jgi:hypothetical protein
VGMTDDTEELFPWDHPRRSVEDTVALMQNDFAYAVANTCVVVHSNNPALVFTANTQRGQLVPRGEVKFTDGTAVEFQDIGMPQINVPHMSVQAIAARVWSIAAKLGLEMAR